jgi:hypothetical protein
MAITKVQFRCVGPEGNGRPILLAPRDYGIRVVLTQQTPFKLAQWLGIESLRGYLLDGEQLCNYLNSWLNTKQLKRPDMVDFEGVLGETDSGVFLQRPYEEVIITFDDECFDKVGQPIITWYRSQKK